MSSGKTALLVDAVDGALAGVILELDELGFRVSWVPSLASALEFIKTHPELSLVVASSDATRARAAEFLALRTFAADVLLIWGVRVDLQSDASAAAPGERPDGVISEPLRPDELRAVITRLLAEQFYPAPILETITRAAVEVLGALGDFKPKDHAILVASRAALSKLSAVIAFGGGVSGHLMVGMTAEHAQIVQQAWLAADDSLRSGRMADLVGELCNQILGRINIFFLTHGVSILHGAPIFIQAPGSSLGRQPSLTLTLADGATQVLVRYCLSDFDRGKLRSPVATRVLPLNKVNFF